MLKLGRDYWFLTWRRIIETIFARPPLVLWLNGKLKVLQKVMTRSSNGFEAGAQTIFKFVEMQPSCKEPLLKDDKRKTINQQREGSQSILSQGTLSRWSEEMKKVLKVKVGRCNLHLYPRPTHCDQIESFPLSAFCPLFQFGPNLIIWCRATLEIIRNLWESLGISTKSQGIFKNVLESLRTALEYSVIPI